jgi:restriction system protein
VNVSAQQAQVVEMARRKSLIGTLSQIQREAERVRLQQVRAHNAAVRQAERAKAAYIRAQAAEEKVRKRLYVESREAEAAAQNEDLATSIESLATLLASTLNVDDFLDLNSLKRNTKLPTWQSGHLEQALPPPMPEQYTPPPSTGLGRIFGGAKYEQQRAAGAAAYQQACVQHAAAEQTRLQQLTAARETYWKAVAEAQKKTYRQHAEIDAFQAELQAGDPDAVVSYFELVLQRSAYPDGFPQQFKLAYVPESRQLVVEYELPSVEVVPTIKIYRYVKSTDTVNATARPAAQIRSTYASVVAQVTLRTVHELFEADRNRFLDVIVFNGVVDSIDRGTGQKVRPCIITLRTTRDAFLAVDVAAVDPQACLKHLSASVSKSPTELVPVRPVLEFSMVDPRFVEESDALSTLDTRTNLMELSPTEFESLIQNLFAEMGLEAKQTRASRDGGVDCVAYDPRPIFGGKVVIQAKRYRDTVGVSAVRDLFGTLLNEGANKGILVTTSGYGQASFDFAQNKPIELIDGSNLLFLLKEHTGIEARINAPEEWRDPRTDD